MNSKKIGKKLVELRGEKSRQEVAIGLKISYSALQMYENGERIPRDEIKIKLAKYYHSTVQDIFFD
jgi:DNA-binding XRE family transcriptional regulator